MVNWGSNTGDTVVAIARMLIKAEDYDPYSSVGHFHEFIIRLCHIVDGRYFVIGSEGHAIIAVDDNKANDMEKFIEAFTHHHCERLSMDVEDLMKNGLPDQGR